MTFIHSGRDIRDPNPAQQDKGSSSQYLLKINDLQEPFSRRERVPLARKDKLFFDTLGFPEMHK